MNLACRRIAVRSIVQVLVPLAVGCGGGRDAGGAQPKAAAAGFAATASVPAGQPMRWAGHVPAGRVIEVRALSGQIHATAATGDSAEIEAKPVRWSGEAPPRVVFTEDAHGIVARVETEDRRGCDHYGERRDDVVDFDVRVPAGVRFVAHSVSGSVESDGVAGPVEAHTVDGSIRLASATAARARTVNGSITATFRAADLESDTELDTVNGQVQVTLPAAANADLSASTLNGEVRIAFPLAGSTEPRRARGTIGRGGRELRLRTVNGSIDVARGA
jgi:hypothetical protein